MQFGYLSNGRMEDGSARARLSPGSGDAQLLSLLEQLARVTAVTAQPFEMLARELSELAASGTGLVVAAGNLRPQHLAAFTRIARSRCPMLVLETASESPSRRHPFGHKCIAGPDDLLDLGETRQ